MTALPQKRPSSRPTAIREGGIARTLFQAVNYTVLFLLMLVTLYPLYLTVITSLSNGKPLKLVRKSGSWYKVRTFGGTTGWVSKKYVKAGAYANVDTQSSGLNIRKGPGTCYGIKGSFAHGTRHLLVTKVSGNWAYVSKNCKSGWCSMNYLDWCHC